MKRKISGFLMLCIMIMLFPMKANAANWYYAAGNYVNSAPVKPTTGLKFYVDYSAIITYGSGAFTAAFDWNGSYIGNVSTVAQYPASPTEFPGYFLINTDSSLSMYTCAQTFYYTSSGILIGGTDPMASTSIYKCRISFNCNQSVFNVNGSFNSTYLEKVVRHEVGHVFLLKHPTNTYFGSVMHQDAPNGSTISATVTMDDRNNIIAKWGSLTVKRSGKNEKISVDRY